MVKDYSIDALNRFLDYALEKGLLKSETAKSRRTAVNKILEKITDEQRADVRKVDLDLEAEHFANRQGAGYIPSSLLTYKSRAKTALTDFVNWVDNPMGFRPSGSGNGKASSKTGGSSATKKAKPAAKVELANAPGHEATNAARAASVEQPAGLTFPVPIRAGLIVQLCNIPFDLTVGEAEKIAQVIKALASQK
jgi:hypothetical protein